MSLRGGVTTHERKTVRPDRRKEKLGDLLIAREIREGRAVRIGGRYIPADITRFCDTCGDPVPGRRCRGCA